MAGLTPTGFLYAQMCNGGMLHLAPSTDDHGNVAEYALCGLWPESQNCTWRKTFLGVPEFVEGGFICRRCAHIAEIRNLK